LPRQKRASPTRVALFRNTPNECTGSCFARVIFPSLVVTLLTRSSVQDDCPAKAVLIIRSSGHISQWPYVRSVVFCCCSVALPTLLLSFTDRLLHHCCHSHRCRSHRQAKPPRRDASARLAGEAKTIALSRAHSQHGCGHQSESSCVTGTQRFFVKVHVYVLRYRRNSQLLVLVYRTSCTVQTTRTKTTYFVFGISSRRSMTNMTQGDAVTWSCVVLGVMRQSQLLTANCK